MDGPVLKCVKCHFSIHVECELEKSAIEDVSKYKCPDCRISVDSFKSIMSLPESQASGRRTRKASEDSSRSDSVFTDEARGSDSDFAKSKSGSVNLDSDVLESPNESPSVTRPTKTSPIQKPVVEPVEKPSKMPTSKPQSKPSKPASKKPGKKNSKGASKGSSRKGSKIKSKDSSKDTSKDKEPKRSKRKFDVTRNTDQSDKESVTQRDSTFDGFRCIIFSETEADFADKSDICAACGSVGDSDHFESKMLFCIHCAQSYHVYCAGVTELTPKLITQGWQCPRKRSKFFNKC